MKVSKMISVVDTHTAGEAARLIVGGIPKFHGKTMADKKIYLETQADDLRKMLMHEPRGHKNMFGAFICEPVHDEADYGIFWWLFKYVRSQHHCGNDSSCRIGLGRCRRRHPCG